MTSRIDTEIRGRYPYPLSATYHRAYYETRDPSLIHDYMLDLFEVTVKYLTSIMIAQYVKDGSADTTINHSLLNLQRPSLGHWQGWLRDIIRFYGRQRQPLAVPELGAFYDQRHTADMFQAYNDLRQMMIDHLDYKGDGKNPPAITTQQFFDLLGTYRNKIAHGARLNVFDRERVCKMLIPAMRELFKNLAFLADYQLVYVTEVKLTPGPTRRVTRYGHYFTDLTGYLPSVSQEPALLEQAVATPNELYILAKGETFRPLLSLHPFMIYRHCERCSDERVFVLNTSRENTLSYLSYVCSHQFSLTEYLDDIRAVLGGVDIAVPLSSPAETAAPPEATAPPEMTAEPVMVAPFVDQGPRVPGPVAPPPATVQCPNPACRATNGAGRKFCTRCGTRLERPAPPPVAAPPVTAPAPVVLCPRCSRANQVGRKFCTACGMPLAGLAPVGGPGGVTGPGPGNLPLPSVGAVRPIVPPPPALFDPANTRPLGPLPPTPPPVAAPAPPTAAPVAPAASVTCATCGQVNPPGRRFCQNCGVTLAAAPPPGPPVIAEPDAPDTAAAPAPASTEPPIAQAAAPPPVEPDGVVPPPPLDAAPSPPPGDGPAPPSTWSKKGK